MGEKQREVAKMCADINDYVIFAYRMEDKPSHTLIKETVRVDLLGNNFWHIVLVRKINAKRLCRVEDEKPEAKVLSRIFLKLHVCMVHIFLIGPIGIYDGEFG